MKLELNIGTRDRLLRVAGGLLLIYLAYSPVPARCAGDDRLCHRCDPDPDGCDEVLSGLYTAGQEHRRAGQLKPARGMFDSLTKVQRRLIIGAIYSLPVALFAGGLIGGWAGNIRIGLALGAAFGFCAAISLLAALAVSAAMRV